jgi:hypothetical protein
MLISYFTKPGHIPFEKDRLIKEKKGKKGDKKGQKRGQRPFISPS